MFKRVQQELAPNQWLIERNERVVKFICSTSTLSPFLQQSEFPSALTEEITQLSAKMGTRRGRAALPAAVVCGSGVNPVSNLLLRPMVPDAFFDQLVVGYGLGSTFHAIVPSFSRVDSLLPCRYMLARR